MARIRTFIGIDIGKVIRDKVVALQDALGQIGTEVKWVEPENLHVSLLFLGEVDDRELPGVCSVVGDTVSKHQVFSLTVEKAGYFPPARTPHVLWVGISEGTKELRAIHDSLEPPLLKLGCYRREERKYTPHVTLGRVRSDRPAAQLTAALKLNAGWYGGHVEIREVLVMSSELTPKGPIYSVLSRAKLKE
jgi:2'-5' RNA ligase